MLNSKYPIIPVVAALILDEQGAILAARRRIHLENAGKWEFPGGKLMSGEAPEACLKREIQEEMGVAIEVLSPFYNVNCLCGEASILLMGYFCRLLERKWQLTDHDTIRWLKISELSAYDFTTADILMIQELSRKKALGDLPHLGKLGY